MKRPLEYNIYLGRTKPETLVHPEHACPFCDVAHLTDILDKQGDIIWLMNKYPVLKDTWPTVIIETADCHADYTTMSLQEATRIMDFSLEKWFDTLQRPEFKSVLFFKNVGPMSGGSLRHPHSQIIGLREHSYEDNVSEDNFTGLDIHEDHRLHMTFSLQPIIGFYEFNMHFDATTDRKIMALRLQQLIRFIQGTRYFRTQSYNVFYYDLHTEGYYLKVVPRYITSPLHMGYGLSQVCNKERAEQVIATLREYLL